MSSPADIRFQRFTLCPGVHLSVNSTRKLKTILVKLFFTGDLDGSVTRRVLIPMVLRRGTRNFHTLQAIARHLEGLYGASLADGVLKIGEWHVISFRLEAVNGRFLPGRQEVFRDALRFLKEMIFDPFLERENFRAQEVAQEKHNLGRLIESLVDDKDQYAAERLIREMCPNEPYRLYEYGDAAQLPAIDAAGLTREWEAWARTHPLEIYAAGDVEAAAMRELFSGVFGEPRRNGFQPAGLPPPVAAQKTRFVEERLAVNQGKLGLGFRHGITYARGDFAAAVLMNGILGSFSHSKLFQNVREKASLAYDAHSALEKTKGLLFILSGIAVENHQKALDIILAQVEAMKRGDISEAELGSTRESLDNHLQMLMDNFSSLMEVDFVWRRHGQSFDLENYRRRLREVTRERIVEAARKLELDTVYFLRN